MRVVTCQCRKYTECFPKNITAAEIYSAGDATAITTTYINETAYVKNNLGFYEYVAQPDTMVCRNAKTVECSAGVVGAVLTAGQSSVLHGLKQSIASAC